MNIEKQNNWKQSGDMFKTNQTGNEVDSLPVGVYQLHESLMGPYLIKNSDAFEFPYKVYDVQHNLINRIKKTYDNTKGNLGVLFNGIKGTGKTVTAELICNKLELPIILVTDNRLDVEGFLQTVHQDVIVFIDEYEKVFARDGKDTKDLLSIMDGVLNSQYRRVFMFTTNSKNINDNLLQRPGRIRYLREFGNLSLNAIIEIVDDMLQHKHLRNETIDFISRLELITIDIVKAVISEVNIHEEDPKEFKDVFNVVELQDTYEVCTVEGGKSNTIHFRAKVVTGNGSFKKVRDDEEMNDEEDYNEPGELIGQYFYVDGRDYGIIDKIIDDNNILCKKNVYEPKKGTYVDKLIQYSVERRTSRNTQFADWKMAF